VIALPDMKTALISLTLLVVGCSPVLAQKTACGTARWTGYNNDVLSQKMTSELSDQSVEDTKHAQKWLGSAGYKLVPCADAKVKLILEYHLYQYSSSKPIWMRFTVSIFRGGERFQKSLKITDPDTYGQLVFKEVKDALDWSLQAAK
jgi:hypothetical protein